MGWRYRGEELIQSYLRLLNKHSFGSGRQRVRVKTTNLESNNLESSNVFSGKEDALVVE